MQNLRIDLLGETIGDELIQIEVQTTNDASIPLRMLEYLVLVNRVHGRIPRQIVLYVGREPLRMASELKWPDGEVRFTLLDMRSIDGEPLAANSEPSDNVLSILGRLKDGRAALRSILQKLSRPERDQAEYYFQALLILAGLRGLEEIVREEATKMLTIDISENKVLGPAYKRGLQEGRQEGLQEGLRGLLLRQIEAKFGPLPSWAQQRLSDSQSQELEQLGIRLLEANTLEDLLR